MVSEDTKKIDIVDILKNYIDLDIYKIKTYDFIRQCCCWVYYLRINRDYKLQIKKGDYFCLRKLGIHETII